MDGVCACMCKDVGWVEMFAVAIPGHHTEYVFGYILPLSGKVCATVPSVTLRIGFEGRKTGSTAFGLKSFNCFVNTDFNVVVKMLYYTYTRDNIICG